MVLLHTDCVGVSVPQGNYTSNVAQFFINLVTFWILYSYLVPISLFVTMEIVKFWQVLPCQSCYPCASYSLGDSSDRLGSRLQLGAPGTHAPTACHG